MKITTINIANVICRCIKNLSDDTTDALLCLQVTILALLYAKSQDNVILSEFDLSEVNKLGLNIQYTKEQLDTIINLHAQLPPSIEIYNDHDVSGKLIKGAVCSDSKILVYFNPAFKNLIFPTDEYSIFNVYDLCSYHSANTLALYLLLSAEQNSAYIHSGGSHTYTFDLYHFCRMLGLKDSANSNPGCISIDCLIDTVMPELIANNPKLNISYNIRRDRSIHRLTSIDLHLSGLKSKGIYGPSPTEIINGGIPRFTNNIGLILRDLIINKNTMFFRRDALGRCVSATALLTADSVIATGKKGGVKSVTPLGYDKLRHLRKKDGKFRIVKAHLIARRFSGPDIAKNLIVAIALANSEMYKIENSIAKYLQCETGTVVLYYVEPMYTSNCLVPDMIRIEALNLDKRDNELRIAVEIHNVPPGTFTDHTDDTHTEKRPIN